MRDDARTPGTIDAEQVASMPQGEAMEALGLKSTDEYQRVMRDIEPVLALRDNREAQGGMNVPIVISRRNVPERSRGRIFMIPPLKRD